MAQKIVAWTARAQKELKKVLEFYNYRNQSNTYSSKLLKEIEENLDLLLQNPFLGKLSENKETRVLVIREFLIFYDLTSTEIHPFFLGQPSKS